MFNDEGCVERELWSLRAAEEARDDHQAASDSAAYAAEMCPEHDERPRENCEECNVDNDGDEEV